ncbi:hypothetical protein [Herbidospora cretacea]|uniref:hypothetical protein n=1 Tax=Herbidospora cretacea TaxID=28444 RepID=UPI0004C2FD70|nr:hypothetical protein [Herbidospora cretacea]
MTKSKIRDESERALADSAAAQAEYDVFSREAALMAAEQMERSNMPGAAESADVLRRAYDAPGTQLAEAQRSVSEGSKAHGIGVGTGDRAELTAGKAVGNDMLDRGTSKTKFGEGIDLGVGLDTSQDSGREDDDSSQHKNGDDSNQRLDHKADDPPCSGIAAALERQITLSDHSGSAGSVPRDWLSPRDRLTL